MTRPRRVLVTGSRDWSDRAAIHAALDAQLAELGPFTLVHGGCKGADWHAHEWAAEHHVDTDLHLARWATEGNAAGPKRNQRMVDAGADVCLAFIRNDSRGASGCVGMARAAGIPVILKAYNDDIELPF